MEDRNGFIKKVYGILAAQLTFTAAMTSLPFLFEGFRAFMNKTLVLVPLLAVLAIIVELAIICNKDLARRVPTNYICMGVFTFCEAYLVSFTASVYDPSVVLTAAFMTAAIVTGLSVYAWNTKTDFSVLGGAFYMISCGLLMFCLFAILF